MVKRLSLIFAILFFSSFLSYAQNISALASVDSSNYLVGDFINYTLEIRADKNLEIIYPLIQDSLNNVEIIKESEPVVKEDETIKAFIFHYVVSHYDSSEITIPPIAVNYKTADDTLTKVVLSNSVTFNVHTVEVIPQAEIQDVKSPLTIPLDWRLLLLWILIGAIILGTVYFFYKRYQKKKLQQPVKKKIIKIPAHIKAMAELDNLEKEQLWQKGLIKDYHSNITGIIRGYFEERFELPALELTTSESMNELRKVKDASVILKSTNEFLNNADLVKFAKFIPLDSVNEEMMKQARDIVTKTIPEETEPEIVEEEAQNV